MDSKVSIPGPASVDDRLRQSGGGPQVGGGAQLGGGVTRQ
jgi:hypothetical protein